MRLQLTVLRHGLPPVQVLWTSESTVRTPLVAAGNSITISQFLEQVNEVLPLESEDWGLEDYSVEVRGFECLHFAELNQVLKEDDEVCIRPLQTHDLRFRKISGRHQIAADGKHLIDGVAFGRPFLRRADRPAIRIPPRKRRRVTYDEADDLDSEEPNNERQVILRAGFDSAQDVTAGDGSDDDEEFAPDDEDEGDLGAELQDLQNDLGGAVDMDDGISQDDIEPHRITRSRRSPKGLGLLKLVDEFGRPFPGKYSNPLLDMYGQDEAPVGQSGIRLGKRGTTDLTQNSPEHIRGILHGSSASPQYVSRRDSTASNRNVRFEHAEATTPATVREREDSEDADDTDFELGEVDESDKENAEPQNEGTEPSDSLFEGSQSSSSTSSDDQLSEDETSSSGSSSSSSGSDSQPGQQPSNHRTHEPQTPETSETSSSGSSSSSGSDSEPEPPKTGQERMWVVHDSKSEAPPNGAEPVVTASATKTIRPGNRNKQTRCRNKRKKESKKLRFIKSKGILPPTATKSDLRKFESETTESERQEMIAAGGVATAFEDKKQQLLTSIAAGGVDISLSPGLQGKDTGMFEDSLPMGDPQSNAAAADLPAGEGDSSNSRPGYPTANEPLNPSTIVEVQDSGTDMPANVRESPLANAMSTTISIGPQSETMSPVDPLESLAKNSQSTPGAIEASKSITATTPESQHRRSKLDMSGAKRMVFGSLGLRTPKTKEDEIKTREKLMRDVRPAKEPHVSEQTGFVEDIAAPAGDESWKDKIDLRAVECCYEGIELSTPPFPFVQRWDPQQRGHNMGNGKKRKGKKRKRNNNDYYDDSSSNRKNKVVRLCEDDRYEQEADSEQSIAKANAEGDDQELMHNERNEDSIKANQQLLHETEDASADTLVEVQKIRDLTNDLPTLPQDMSICSSLTLEKSIKGNIVAFKQLEMSAETNWQPKISEYRTAIVDEILDDGTLSMTLAKRDQPLKNIQYNAQTGERLYSKFEMPGYSDEDCEDRNGKLEISFDELISPVLVEAVSQKGNQDRILEGQDDYHLNGKALTEDAPDTDAGPQGLSHDGPIHQVSNNAAAEPSEEARQEISELIRDAGWTSSINHELTTQQDEKPSGQSDHVNETALMRPSSPKFHGFSSSPLTYGFQVASSPPPAAVHTSRHVHASGSEIAESVSPYRHDDSPTRSNTSNRKSQIDYPDLPQVNDDSEVFQQEAQDRSGLLEADHQIASQDLNSSSSIRRSPSLRIGSPILTSLDKDPHTVGHVISEPDSDESLPELFSQAFEKQVSQGMDIKRELSEEDPISPPSHRRSKRNSRINSSQRDFNRNWEPESFKSEDENEGGSTPCQSQTGFSSQIVDLTISSDTVDPPDDSYVDDDSYVLPKGSGWVHKPKTRESRRGTMKKTTRRSTRSS